MRHNCVVIDTTYGLIYFPHLKMQVKVASSLTIAKPQVVLFDDSITVTPMTTKTITTFVDWSLISMEYNRYRDSSGKIQRSRESDNIQFNIKNNRQKDSSHSNQHNGITLCDQQEHTNCRFLGSHSGLIQIH